MFSSGTNRARAIPWALRCQSILELPLGAWLAHALLLLGTNGTELALAAALAAFARSLLGFVLVFPNGAQLACALLNSDKGRIG